MLNNCLDVFSQANGKPDYTRFNKVILDNDLNEPMELDISKDGMIYYIERIGHLNKYDPLNNKKYRIATLNVRFAAEDGLIGLALDPDFEKNHWLYLYYGNPSKYNNEFTNVLSRFTLIGNSLRNKIDLLHVPVIPDGVSHSGGSLAFDSKGNLYLSTGDNTNPFESGGYSPTDDREGRLRFDALKSSGNTNDLRGKILRIHPEKDGTYSIPKDNLFPIGTKNTRPEIYVMGCRNPFRISIDKYKNFLYWGEVGPDAGKDSLNRGPKGYDEVNQARTAGNFGWPLFVANNKPYYNFDFEKKVSEGIFLSDHPINFSRNNTGLRDLPPAQKAFIWYPYDSSGEFPELGTGGRNAMAGPVYYYDDYANVEGKFPKYFNNKLFIFDWMRGWIFNVTLNSNGDFESLDRFMPHEEFNHPIDMAFNSNGILYMLEYGTYWRAKNKDAKLIRIDYNENNRKPIAKITADKMVGSAPLKVNFSATGSYDFDKSDSLKFEWHFTQKSKIQSTSISPSFVFTKNGNYTCMVKVIDSKGNYSINSLQIKVGNEPPNVSINWYGNRSIYFNNSKVKYDIKIRDKEDIKINDKNLLVNFYHLPEGEDIQGLVATGEKNIRGKVLMEQSDCNGCHALNKKSVGPTYLDISKRYSLANLEKLTRKVIDGGGGVWTKDHVMSAHPQMLKEDVEEILNYILSIGKSNTKIKPKGEVHLNHFFGNYLMIARYKDAGGLIGQNMIRLRPATFFASDADEIFGVAKKNNVGSQFMSYNENKAWICFKNIDLTGINSVKLDIYSPNLLGEMDVRIGSASGPIIAKLPIAGKGKEEVKGILSKTNGVHNIFFVFNEIKGDIGIWKRLDLKSIEFGQ